MRQFLSLRLSKVDADRALVAAADLPPEMDTVLLGAHDTRGVAASRRLHVHDRRALVGQQPAGEWARHDLGELHHAQACEQALLLVCSHIVTLRVTGADAPVCGACPVTSEPS